MTISSPSRWIPSVLAGVTGAGNAAVAGVTGHTVVPYWLVVAAMGVLVPLAGWRNVVELIDDHRCRARERRVGEHLADEIVRAPSPTDKSAALTTYLRFTGRSAPPPAPPPQI